MWGQSPLKRESGFRGFMKPAIGEVYDSVAEMETDADGRDDAPCRDRCEIEAPQNLEEDT